MNSTLVEMVAVRLYENDLDVDDVRRINAADGFTYDHAPHGNNWLRTEGARMSEAEIQAAIALAAEWQEIGLPVE